MQCTGCKKRYILNLSTIKSIYENEPYIDQICNVLEAKMTKMSICTNAFFIYSSGDEKYKLYWIIDEKAVKELFDYFTKPCILTSIEFATKLGIRK